VTLNWRKSSHSANNAACVETAWTPIHIAYHDSKQSALPAPDRPTLLIPHPAAHTFLTLLRSVRR
jgi:hypothetical protein